MRYGYFVSLTLIPHRKSKKSKTQNGHISFKAVQKPKNKGTLLSSTLKVQENKVPLFFHFQTVLNDIWPF